MSEPDSVHVEDILRVVGQLNNLLQEKWKEHRIRVLLTVHVGTTRKILDSSKGGYLLDIRQIDVQPDPRVVWRRTDSNGEGDDG